MTGSTVQSVNNKTGNFDIVISIFCALVLHKQQISNEQKLPLGRADIEINSRKKDFTTQAKKCIVE
jgi:hypothetical protein